MQITYNYYYLTEKKHIKSRIYFVRNKDKTQGVKFKMLLDRIPDVGELHVQTK